MGKKIIMNPPSVWTDQILWRRTVHENSLSIRMRIKWAWNTIFLYSSSAGHKPKHQQPCETNRNKCGGQEHQPAKHKWSHDADAWGCSFLPRNTNPAVWAVLQLLTLRWALQSTSKAAPATGGGFGHFCFVTEEACNELSKPREIPEFSKSILLSGTPRAPWMRLIHQSAIRQHSGDGLTSSEMLFPSVTPRSQEQQRTRRLRGFSGQTYFGNWVNTSH